MNIFGRSEDTAPVKFDYDGESYELPPFDENLAYNMTDRELNEWALKEDADEASTERFRVELRARLKTIQAHKLDRKDWNRVMNMAPTKLYGFLSAWAQATGAMPKTIDGTVVDPVGESRGSSEPSEPTVQSLNTTSATA